MNKDKTVVPHAVGLYVAKFIKPLQRTQKMRKKKIQCMDHFFLILTHCHRY